jgi:flagellar protein FlaF
MTEKILAGLRKNRSPALFLLEAQFNRRTCVHISAYKKTIAETESPRQIERRILTRITSGMSAGQASYDEAARKERLQILSDSLRIPLSENLQLWGAWKIDLLSPSNQMSAEMRSSLISTAMFVERHTASLMAGEGEVQSLVAINQAMIDGLSGRSLEQE